MSEPQPELVPESTPEPSEAMSETGESLSERVPEHQGPAASPPGGWQQHTKGDGTHAIVGAAVDGAGGIIYLAGSFSNSVTLGNTTLRSNGATDVFVAKLDARGGFVWAIGIGGSGEEKARAIASSGDGHLYVHGMFKSATLDPSLPAPIPTNADASGSTSDIFVLKISASDGKVVWARGYGGSGDDEVFGRIALIPNGELVIAGEFVGDRFDGMSLTKVAKDAARTGFVAGLKADGSLAWAVAIGASVDVGVYEVVADSAGTLYIGGVFRGDFVSAGVPGLKSVDDGDGFFGQLTPNTTAGKGYKISWIKAISGNKREEVTGLALDGKGHLYVTGIFGGDLYLGATPLSSTGGYDNFLARVRLLDQKVLYRRHIASVGHLFGPRLVSHPGGDVYLAVPCGRPSVLIEGKKLDASGDPKNVGSGLLYTRWTADGLPVWASFLGSSDGVSAGLTVGAERLYLFGQFKGSIYLGQTPLMSRGGFDLDSFVWELKGQ